MLKNLKCEKDTPGNLRRIPETPVANPKPGDFTIFRYLQAGCFFTLTREKLFWKCFNFFMCFTRDFKLLLFVMILEHNIITLPLKYQTNSLPYFIIINIMIRRKSLDIYFRYFFKVTFAKKCDRLSVFVITLLTSVQKKNIWEHTQATLTVPSR